MTMKVHLTLLALLALFVLTACGVSAPPPDEVTETWTSGDDAPLDASDPPR